MPGEPGADLHEGDHAPRDDAERGGEHERERPAGRHRLLERGDQHAAGGDRVDEHEGGHLGDAVQLRDEEDGDREGERPLPPAERMPVARDGGAPAACGTAGSATRRATAASTSTTTAAGPAETVASGDRGRRPRRRRAGVTTAGSAGAACGATARRIPSTTASASSTAAPIAAVSRRRPGSVSMTKSLGRGCPWLRPPRGWRPGPARPPSSPPGPPRARRARCAPRR